MSWVWNNLFVEINEAMKGLNAAHCLGGQSGKKHAKFSRVRRDASGVDVVHKVQYFVSKELALGGL